MFGFVGTYSWTVTYSSLHQFVTTPTDIESSDSVSTECLNKKNISCMCVIDSILQ